MADPRKDAPAARPEPLRGQQGRQQTKVTPGGDAQLEQHARDAEIDDDELSPDEHKLLERERAHEQRRSP